MKMENSVIIVETPDYIQTLQLQVAQMKTDDTKALFLIDKKTLEKLIILLNRDEVLRINMRNRAREKNPHGKQRMTTAKEILISPVMIIPN